jgi:hypothetical protein
MKFSFLAGPVLALAAACAPEDSSKPAPGAASNSTLIDQLTPGTRGLVVLNPFGNRPTFYDFDRVPYGAQPRHVFRIKNEAAQALTIHDLLESCGCLRATVQYKSASGEVVAGSRARSGPVIVVPAGQEFELVCAIDTSFVENMNLDKLAQVRMRSDSPDAPYLTFELHLIVERIFRAVPLVADLGLIPRSAGKSLRSDVSTETRGALAKITGVESVEGPFTATADATHVGDEPVWIVDVNAKPGLPLGPVRGKVRLGSTGLDGTGTGPPFDLEVLGTVVEDIVPSPSVFAFGTYARGTTRTCKVDLEALAPEQTFRCGSMRLTGDHADKLRIERTALQPKDDGSARVWQFELTAPTDVPIGAFAGTVEIVTDHPAAVTVRVPYNGNPQ